MSVRWNRKEEGGGGEIRTEGRLRTERGQEEKKAGSTKIRNCVTLPPHGPERSNFCPKPTWPTQAVNFLILLELGQIKWVSLC